MCAIYSSYYEWASASVCRNFRMLVRWPRLWCGRSGDFFMFFSRLGNEEGEISL